jgi:hypothetical protein
MSHDDTGNDKAEMYVINSEPHVTTVVGVSSQYKFYDCFVATLSLYSSYLFTLLLLLW